MVKTCPKCNKGEIDYSMSEVHLIPKTEPQEAGIEGLCSECQTHVYVKFKEYETELTLFDDFMNEDEKEIISA